MSVKTMAKFPKNPNTSVVIRRHLNTAGEAIEVRDIYKNGREGRGFYIHRHMLRRLIDELEGVEAALGGGRKKAPGPGQLSML